MKYDMFQRIRRAPERLKASYCWEAYYEAYKDITGNYPSSHTKTRWRRMGKLFALSELEGIAKTHGFDGVFAWNTEDVGMKGHEQVSLSGFQ